MCWTLTNRITFLICCNNYHFIPLVFRVGFCLLKRLKSVLRSLQCKYRASARQTKGTRNDIWPYHFVHLIEIVTVSFFCCLTTRPLDVKRNVWTEIVSKTFWLFVCLHSRACWKNLYLSCASNINYTYIRYPAPPPPPQLQEKWRLARRSILLCATFILLKNFRVHNLSLFRKTWANVGKSYCTQTK